MKFFTGTLAFENRNSFLWAYRSYLSRQAGYTFGLVLRVETREFEKGYGKLKAGHSGYT